MLYPIVLGLLLTVIAGCQGLKRPAGLQDSSMNPRTGSTRWDHKFKTVGKLFGDVALVSAGKKDRPLGTVYKELWKAALYVLRDFSFEKVDFMGGTIITPWFTLSNKASERFQVCCKIIQNDDWVKSITVSVSHQMCISGQWRDQEKRKNLAFYIKDAILTTARRNHIQILAELPTAPPKNRLIRP
jgi:hypothetical protein